MRSLALAIALIVLSPLSATAAPSAPSAADGASIHPVLRLLPREPAASAGRTAFVDVNVVPMDAERVLMRQTVLIEGDRITAIGPVADLAIPADARRIDGAGRFLLPGLGEMHGHNPPVGSTTEYVQRIYFLFLANGVTTVRGMLGWPGQLELREQVRDGRLLGPTLLLAGPSFSGASVASPQAATLRVEEQKREGWDLLKVHPGVKREVYDAMANAADRLGIRFSGHIPLEVGLEYAIERRQETVDHLDGYIELLGGDQGPLDPARLAAIVQRTRETNTWVVPTMALWETIIGAADLPSMLAYPELRYLPTIEIERWRASYERRLADPKFDRARARRIAENRLILLKALADGGARILFGTDAPQQFSVPGFSIHREFPLMLAAGMSRYDILRSATRTVGEHLAATDRFGVIAPGARADLVLVRANPLADLAHLREPAGVMVRGRWLAGDDIAQVLAAYAERRD